MGWLDDARRAWRTHKYSFLVSLTVTLAGLLLYTHTYLAEAGSPLAQFVDAFELKSYDARLRLRGRTAPEAPIVIVAIDQATLGRLGSWPFSRAHYARLLERLSADGAAVVGFDINFPKPDEKSGLELLRRARADYLERTPPPRRDPNYLKRLEALEAEADADARFAESIGNAGNVVLGYFFFTSRTEVGYVDAAAQQETDSYLAFSSYTTRPAKDPQGNLPPPLSETYRGEEGYLAEANLAAFTEAAELRVGFFNFTVDADGVARRAPLVLRYDAAWSGASQGQANFFPSLDIQILRRYLRLPEHEMVLLYNSAGVEAVLLGERRIPTDSHGRMLIHYQGGPFTYPYVSFADVVEGRTPAGTFRDKIVLIGPTALAVADIRPTPFAEGFHPGVEIHANILETILGEHFLQRGTREQLIDLAFLLAFGLGVGTVLALVRPAWSASVAVAALAAFLVVVYAALAWFDSWLNLVLPASVWFGNFAGVSAARFLIEEREKRRVHGAFRQYVPAGLLQELMKNPEKLRLGGEERDLTILFSDIRGFTALSEQLTPLELTNFLNAYTDEMTEIVFRNWGTLDKFQGDAVMAFWGAPYEQDDHALRACRAGLEMSQRVDELRQQWQAEGKPDINIGVGMSSGRAVVGNMGSRKRFNYTVLGDTVNLASRLEGVNKEYFTRILVSESTCREANDLLGPLARRLCRHFALRPEEFAAADGSERARRARSVALYLARAQRLAPAAEVTARFRVEGELDRAQADVEKWLGRDKKLRQLVEDARRVLRPLVFRQLDWIRVKGKQEPVAIYELVDFADEENRHAERLALFHTGLEAYRGQQWEAALDAFDTLLRKYPDDSPARLMAARCRQYQSEPPPPDWDGVYVMKSK